MFSFIVFSPFLPPLYTEKDAKARSNFRRNFGNSDGLRRRQRGKGLGISAFLRK
jgi:hypothetical protein